MSKVIYAFILNRVCDIHSKKEAYAGMKLEKLIAEGTGEDIPINKYFDNGLIEIFDTVKKRSSDEQEIQKTVLIRSEKVFPLVITYHDFSEKRSYKYNLLWENDQVVREDINNSDAKS